MPTAFDTLKAERTDIQDRLDALDSYLPERTREIQRHQKVGADRAEPVARKQLESERRHLAERARALDTEIARYDTEHEATRR